MTEESQTSSDAPDTPLMRQYRAIKEKHPNAVLLFRMGDFYETFDRDAHIASDVLGITLTKRANGQARDVPLAGFPHHALDTYLPRLIRAGYRVAICEQLEDPKRAKKIVKRGVVEVVTPGVSLRDQLLEPNRSNYLAALHWGTDRTDSQRVAVSFVDASTGEFQVTEVADRDIPGLIRTISPSEIIFDKRQRHLVDSIATGDAVLTSQEDWCFSHDFAYETLLRHFGTHSLKGFGVDDLTVGIRAAGAILNYLSETQKGSLSQIRRIGRYDDRDYMTLDPQTLRNLELVASMHDSGYDGSLVQILDATMTPMGSRLLRNWLIRPMQRVAAIKGRLDAVQEMTGHARPRARLRELLDSVGDMERLLTRICLGRASPRDVRQLKQSLVEVPEIKRILESFDAAALTESSGSLDDFPEIVKMISETLVDEPPASLAAGGVICTGVSEELDELRLIASSGKEWLAQLQVEESERTGIPSLKVGYNKVFGYYIEITHAHKERVPSEYIRKQTLVNAERYITPALKEYEEKILTAEERIGDLETELFTRLVARIASDATELQHTARAIATLDVFQSLADVAARKGYTRPEVHEGLGLEIEDGRHPVVEATLPPGEPFIPNTVKLHPETDQVMIITGPNMAGKSVVLRQTGLIVLMAQIGSFVPATSASVGIVDKIFTRVGASDNLAAGESTFLVEMNETANILNNATSRSLILFDEVGRGTSTFDGISIAWAIVEYLHEHPELAARTLFATHYHELNLLAERFDRIVNFRIQVHEHRGKVVFLRKLVPGGADHSYGIEVARMAGLPQAVIGRARQILAHLETQKLSLEEDASGGVPRLKRVGSALETIQDVDFGQLSMFNADPDSMRALRELEKMDPERMTPMEALLQLARLKEILGGEG